MDYFNKHALLVYRVSIVLDAFNILLRYMVSMANIWSKIRQTQSNLPQGNVSKHKQTRSESVNWFWLCKSLYQAKTNNSHLPIHKCPTSTHLHPTQNSQHSPKYVNCKILQQGLNIKIIYCYICYFYLEIFVA